MEKLKYIPILMYHNILERKNSKEWNNYCLEPGKLARQLDYLLKKKYTTLDFADLEEIINGGKTCPKNPIMLTFDDAYSDTLENAMPLLISRDMKGIFPVVTDYIGKASDWEKYLPSYITVTREQVSNNKSPLISFESHTSKHTHLTLLTPKELNLDLVGSKDLIESITGVKVRAVFYPYGSYNDKVKNASAKAGYKFGLAIATTKKTVNEDLFEMRRVFIKSSDSLFAFKRKISAWYLRYRGLREPGRSMKSRKEE